MALSRRSGRSRFTLALLVLTSITVLTINFRSSGVVHDVRGAAATVFAPVREALGGVFKPVSNAWNGVFGYGDLETENTDLRDRVSELEGELARTEDARQRLEELEQANGLPVTGRFTNVVARVTAGPVSSFDHTFEVNRGSAAGVKEGMPVVGGAGLVGRVVQVTGDRSVIQLITDPGIEVGVRHADTGEIGIAEGNGSREPLAVVDIRPDITVESEDLIFTSGVERSIYPADIPVGRVVSAEQSDDRLTQELRVEPLEDLQQLTYVTILLWDPPA
ncbi:MAG: rod shape-determining protein MreC [Acidimicrobiales bacterium]